MDELRQAVTKSTIHRRSARRAYWTLLLVAVAAGGLWSSGAIGQVSVSTGGRPTMRPLDPKHPRTYREVLVFGLRARLPTELEFIDSVADAVEQGELPPRLVDQTYFWARTRSGNSLYGRPNRPIVYFIPAMEARVKKLRLDVDLAGGLP